MYIFEQCVACDIYLGLVWYQQPQSCLQEENGMIYSLVLPTLPKNLVNETELKWLGGFDISIPT